MQSRTVVALITAALVIAAIAAWYFLAKPQTAKVPASAAPSVPTDVIMQSTSQGTLPALGGVTNSVSSSVVNPTGATNPFQSLTTNPFQ